MREEIKSFSKTFRTIAFVLLLLLVVEIPVCTLIRKVSYDSYLTQLASGNVSGDVGPLETSNCIYTYNCILCVASIISQILYWSYKRFVLEKKKFNIKQSIIRNWPCILLALFMMWTSVGCIQAGMEMDAEIYIKKSSSIDEVPQRIIDIANWSSGDRMANTSNVYQNAKDRAWHGCENLKDGYFSFMFYATVFLNIFMLGNEAEDKKRWIIRALLLSSFFVGLLALLAFLSYTQFAGITYFDRASFNNRNHFGYYISVVFVMSICAFLNDKNWYFKGMAFINTLLYLFLLFACDTFGAYLGVLFAMIFMLFVVTIKLVRKKEIAKFVEYLLVFALFVVASNSIGRIKSTRLGTSTIVFDYSTMTFNIGDSTYFLSLNSLSEEQAESLKIASQTKDGDSIKWGKQLNKLDNKQSSFVKSNFDSLFRDINSMLGFFKTESNNNSGENSSTVNEYAGLSDMEVLNKISSKYPKVIGESLEEWQARQAKIEEEFQAYTASKEQSDSSTSEEVTLEDISLVGSGRGPVWIRSLDLMNQRPWFGWGLENMLNEFYNQYKISEGRTHNLVLQLGGTTGIPGVIMYLVATISIFFKVLFDAKFRKFNKKQLGIIFGIYLICTIAINIIISKITDKVFFNGIFTAMTWALLTIIIFTKKVHFRVKDWNEFEFIGASVFVSYMISDLFGNSAFYTSPYFMIFLGILAYEMIYKKSFFEDTLPQESRNNKVKS